MFFLARANMKEPKDFYEKEIQEQKMKKEEFLYRKPIVITKKYNLATP